LSFFGLDEIKQLFARQPPHRKPVRA